MAYKFTRIDAHHCVINGVRFGPVVCPNMTRYYGVIKYGLAPEGKTCADYHHRYHAVDLTDLADTLDQWERDKDQPSHSLRDDPVFQALVDFDELGI